MRKIKLTTATGYVGNQHVRIYNLPPYAVTRHDYYTRIDFRKLSEAVARRLMQYVPTGWEPPFLDIFRNSLTAGMYARKQTATEATDTTATATTGATEATD